jgi:hypothetical protein
MSAGHARLNPSRFFVGEELEITAGYYRRLRDRLYLPAKEDNHA